MTDERENEKHVRAFYEATAPGHRERLRSLQVPNVVYDLWDGMPVVPAISKGSRTSAIAFSPISMERWTFALWPKNSSQQVTKSLRSVALQGTLERLPFPSTFLLFMSGQSERAIFNGSEPSPTRRG